MLMKNKKTNKITHDLNDMLDGYDGITGKDYKWKMIDDPKGNHKYCYEVRIFRHAVKTGQRFSEITTNGQTIN